MIPFDLKILGLLSLQLVRLFYLETEEEMSSRKRLGAGSGCAMGSGFNFIEFSMEQNRFKISNCTCNYENLFIYLFIFKA